MTDSRFEDERIKRLEAEIAHLKELAAAHRAGDQLAVQTALASSKELAEKHNDLIRAAERKDETYALKTDLSRVETFQARLLGGMVVIGAVGLGYLVKLWLT